MELKAPGTGTFLLPAPSGSDVGITLPPAWGSSYTPFSKLCHTGKPSIILPSLRSKKQIHNSSERALTDLAWLILGSGFITQEHWHSGPANCLVDGCPVYSRMFRRTPGLHPLHINSTPNPYPPLSSANKNVSKITKRLLVDKSVSNQCPRIENIALINVVRNFFFFI